MTRGDIYRVRFPARSGHEQSGPRFAIIVQANELLGLFTAIVAPTSQSAAAATFRPQVEVEGASTRVLVEQMRAVDVTRLGDVVGHLALNEQRSVDDALSVVLDI